MPFCQLERLFTDYVNNILFLKVHVNLANIIKVESYARFMVYIFGVPANKLKCR